MLAYAELVEKVFFVAEHIFLVFLSGFTQE